MAINLRTYMPAINCLCCVATYCGACTCKFRAMHILIICIFVGQTSTDGSHVIVGKQLLHVPSVGFLP